MEPPERSDDYWNGAIDAFMSQGMDMVQVMDALINMGCDHATAEGLCGRC